MEITMSQAAGLASTLARHVEKEGTLFAIPRGGIPTALLIAAACERNVLVATLDEFNSSYSRPWYLVDDIVVTGKTIADIFERMGPVIATRKSEIDGVLTLVEKLKDHHRATVAGISLYAASTGPMSEWVVFPWETKNESSGPGDAVRRLIEYVGDDPDRPGVEKTPARVLRYLDELREGKEVDTSDFAVFSEERYHDLMVVKDIPFSSLCEHHMLPFFGRAHVGYIPKGQVLGLSKMARIVNKHASGLTIQESLTHNVAEAIVEVTGAEDVAVVTRAIHSCMVSRGVKAAGSEAIASAMLGHFLSQPELRMEFFSIVGG